MLYTLVNKICCWLGLHDWYMPCINCKDQFTHCCRYDCKYSKYNQFIHVCKHCGKVRWR